jgi:RNA polymerase sigma-70 factor (ECF subfamily)
VRTANTDFGEYFPKREISGVCRSVGPNFSCDDGTTLGSQPITLILHDLASGDKDALNRLMPLVYAELRKVADAYLRNERPGNTLQPTALVHEAYIRLIKQDQPDFRSRAQFLGVASHIMRQILIDHARLRNAGKRGGGMPKYSLEEAWNAAVERPSIMLALDDALCQLERKDPRKTRLIEMRFFGGLTAEESAEVLELPVEKVRGELRVAQAWLQRELSAGSAAGKHDAG